MIKASMDQIVVGAFQLTLLVTMLNGLRRDKGWFMPPSVTGREQYTEGRNKLETA